MFIEGVVILVILSFAMYWDYRTYRIPNGLIGIGLLSGCVSSLMLRGPGGLCRGIAGMLIPIALLFILFILHVLGAGDIKLFAVLGTFFGYAILHIIAYSFFAGGLLAILYFFVHRNFRERFLYFFQYCMHWIRHFRYPVDQIPPYEGDDGKIHFTPAIWIGTFGYLFLQEDLIGTITGYLA